MSALSLEQVSHRFARVLALDDVSLSVEEGEIVCLLGPSGCGKSTLLRLAAGLEEIQQGRIAINARPVADARRGLSVAPDGRGIGMVFQDYALFPHLTVRENVSFGLDRLSAQEQRRRALDALGRVGMAEYAEEYPHTLSGGQQQRVALARALAPRPRLILLDEPFSGLDARLRHRLAADSWHLLKESGTATLVVTHDPEEAMFLADRIAVMRDGRIVQVDTPERIFTRPNSPFVVRFFSDVNAFEGVVGEDCNIRTPWGSVAGGGLAPGTRAEVLIRYDAVRLVSPTNGAAGVVSLARPLGGHGLVELDKPEGEDTAGTLYARVHWDSLPETGAVVGVEIDPRQTFVFSAKTAT